MVHIPLLPIYYVVSNSHRTVQRKKNILDLVLSCYISSCSGRCRSSRVLPIPDSSIVPETPPPCQFSSPSFFFSILDKKKEIEDLRGGDIIKWRFEKTPIYYTSMPIGVSVNRVGNHFTPFCMVCMRCISPYSKYITLLLYETYIHPCYSLCFCLIQGHPTTK